MTSVPVHIARAPRSEYGDYFFAEDVDLPQAAPRTTALHAVRALLRSAGLDRQRQGKADWNPFGDLVSPNDKVLIKPNWVYHENRSGNGMDCLVTHGSLIEAVLHFLVKARPASVIIGDSPIQGCDFTRLLESCKISDMLSRVRGVVPVRDFRLTLQQHDVLGGKQSASTRSRDEYVCFDLAARSALEPISLPDAEFRVTSYDPAALQRTHAAGRHQYLLAREAIEADVIINMPKLKTHCKAGVTGALKNVVGVNGHKEYLPHHRKGSPQHGGDCYPKSSVLGTTAENLLDRMNGAKLQPLRTVWSMAARAAVRSARLLHDDFNVEGSWHGNDTVWRTCLDLDRILVHGCLDGTIASVPQRRIITITDGIVAGQGEGPLLPEPVRLGLVTLAFDLAAAEWIHATLMGFDPWAIPLIRESFNPRWGVAVCQPADLSCLIDGQPCAVGDLFKTCGMPFRPPRGWLGHCEQASVVGRPGTVI